MHYFDERLRPAVAEGCAPAGRSVEDVDLIVPVFVVAGATPPEEREPLLRRTKEQIAFYGSTPPGVTTTASAALTFMSRSTRTS